MKRVVSVSLGSSRRDHRAEVDVLGERFLLERVGTDGDIHKAVTLIRELDGQVDAIGLGGIDLYIWAAGRRYRFRDAYRMARAARLTPVVDGSGLKNSLERWVVDYLAREYGFPWARQRVLMVAAVDRFGMAEAIAATGCRMVFGDLMFGLGIPIPLRSLRGLQIVVRLLAPIVVQLPFKLVYPTGSQQGVSRPRYGAYYRWADVVAGDFHFIRKYLPDDLAGKVILTNTVTSEDVELLRARGAAALVTTTPHIQGRSFGSNVLEAMLVAVSGRRPEDMSGADYLDLLARMNVTPWVKTFTSDAALG